MSMISKYTNCWVGGSPNVYFGIMKIIMRRLWVTAVMLSIVKLPQSANKYSSKLLLKLLFNYDWKTVVDVGEFQAKHLLQFITLWRTNGVIWWPKMKPLFFKVCTAYSQDFVYIFCFESCKSKLKVFRQLPLWCKALCFVLSDICREENNFVAVKVKETVGKII